MGVGRKTDAWQKTEKKGGGLGLLKRIKRERIV